MNEQNLTHAGFYLSVGCFVTAAGLFIGWGDLSRWMFISFTLVSLGTMNLSFAALNALPDGPSRARKVVRVVGFVLAVAVICLAVTALMDEILYR